MDARTQIRLTVNGVSVECEVEPRLTLADFLREELDLTGTHLGCEHGVCGACTVHVDGRTARACIMLAVQADECEITTVEGLATGEELTAVQRGFWEKHGMQCGFCTPGFLMTVTELLNEHSQPTSEQIAEALGGNLCRCTGYTKIVEAVEEAVRLTASDSGHSIDGTWSAVPESGTAVADAHAEGWTPGPGTRQVTLAPPEEPV